jgi:NTE family protein
LLSKSKELQYDSSFQMLMKNDMYQKQRALVLQGGGALGAYEAGAISVLCEHLSGEDKRNNENQRNGPLFDIVAGTSIGAMNAAVLVSNVVNRKKTWKQAAEVLEHFWTDQAREAEKEDEKKLVH